MLTRMYNIQVRSPGGGTYESFTTDESEIRDPDDGTTYGWFTEDSDFDRICERFNIDKIEFNDFLDTLK